MLGETYVLAGTRVFVIMNTVCKQAGPGVPFLKPLKGNTDQRFSHDGLVTRTTSEKGGTPADCRCDDEYLNFAKGWGKLSGRGPVKDCSSLKSEWDVAVGKSPGKLIYGNCGGRGSFEWGAANTDIDQVRKCCSESVLDRWKKTDLNECCSSSASSNAMKKKCHPQWFGGEKYPACISSKAMQKWCQEEDNDGNPRLLHDKKCNKHSAFAKIGGGKVRDDAIVDYCKGVVKRRDQISRPSTTQKELIM